MKRLFLLCSLLALAACASRRRRRPRPPPPPPPPPPDTTIPLFFDWDRANITPEGQQIVEAAAGASKADGRRKSR